MDALLPNFERKQVVLDIVTSSNQLGTNLMNSLPHVNLSGKTALENFK